jgi:hypothetical protein
MKGIRHFLRDFTATAVKEHLRSQSEDTAEPPDFDEERARAGALYLQVISATCRGSTTSRSGSTVSAGLP